MSDNNKKARSVRAAVEYRDAPALRAAVASGATLEELNELGGTPLQTACASNQYVIAEILIDAGANIWAADRFGGTAGHMIGVTVLPPGHEEDDAKQRVIAKMAARGFVFPPPPQEEVLRRIAAGEWPPTQRPKATR